MGPEVARFQMENCHFHFIFPRTCFSFQKIESCMFMILSPLHRNSLFSITSDHIYPLSLHVREIPLLKPSRTCYTKKTFFCQVSVLIAMLEVITAKLLPVIEQHFSFQKQNNTPFFFCIFFVLLCFVFL